MLLRRWEYRVRQLARALREGGEPIASEFVDAKLNEAQRSLFDGMSHRDQVHSVRTATLVSRSDESGEDLIVAALLHDAGKGRLEVWNRVVFVLLAAASPTLLRWLARPGDGARGALFRLHRHAELGAELAAQAGCDAEVCRLIAAHHSPAAEPRLRALRQADELA